MVIRSFIIAAALIGVENLRAPEHMISPTDAPMLCQLGEVLNGDRAQDRVAQVLGRRSPDTRHCPTKTVASQMPGNVVSKTFCLVDVSFELNEEIAT